MNDRYGIINMLILIQSKNHLNKLTGINKNVNEQVALLNNIRLNIFSNFVPNKKILTFDDRNPHGSLSI